VKLLIFLVKKILDKGEVVVVPCGVMLEKGSVNSLTEKEQLPWG
jgi:hypothetical protein